MAISDYIPGRNNQPPANDAESMEKMRKSVQSLNQQQLAKLLNQFERNRRQLSTDQLQIIENHIEDLRGRSQDAAHQQSISLCDARLKILQERMANGTALPHPEGDRGFGRNTNGNLGTMAGAGVGAALLSWFGFNAYRHGIFGGARTTVTGGARGMFGLTRFTGRTGLNTVGFAWNNPILAALGIGMGAGVTKQVVDYMQSNRNSLIQEIEGIAREQNRPVQEVAHNVGHRIGDYIRSAGSSTVDTFVKGVVWVCQGTIDPNTGAITLPHSSLTPPFFVAYKAGARSRVSGSYATRYLQGFKLNPYDIFGKDNTLNIFQSKEGRMLEAADIVGNQSGDRLKTIELAQNKIDEIRRTDPKRADKLQAELAGALNAKVGPELNDIVNKAKQLNSKGAGDLASMKVEIHDEIKLLEQKIRTGDIPPGTSKEDFKKSQMGKIERKLNNYNTQLGDRMVGLGQNYVDAMNAHTKARLDKAGGGIVDGTRKAMESAGYGFMQVPGGKWILKAAVGYSMMPLAMETASATMNSLEGNVKQKRLQAQKDRGETLSENDEKELSRLENQWKAVGMDVAQVGGGFIPVVGEAIDLYGAISGKDLNGRDLSTTSRVTMGIMGGLGTASLVLVPLTGGLSAIGFRAIRGANAASKGLKTAKTAEQSIDALRKSTNVVDQARKLTTVSSVNKAALNAKGAIQTARNGMQIVSYGMLGWSVAEGAIDFVSHNRLGQLKERSATFVEGLGDSVGEHLPTRRPPAAPTSGQGQTLQHPLSSGQGPQENQPQMLQ